MSMQNLAVYNYTQFLLKFQGLITKWIVWDADAVVSNSRTIHANHIYIFYLLKHLAKLKWETKINALRFLCPFGLAQGMLFVAKIKKCFLVSLL
jgi:hypothetical protein